MSARRDKGEKVPGEREWVMIALDEKVARRQGMPKELPVPKDEFEKMADKGLNPEIVVAWIKDFLTNSPMGQSGEWRRRQVNFVNAAEAYVDKQPLYKKAQEAFAKNDYEGAIKALKKITILDDRDDSAKLNLASAHANKGEHDKALKLLKQVEKTFADDPDYHMTVAQLHVSRQDIEGATNSLVLALEAKPDHRGAMELLVKLGVLTQIYDNPRDAKTVTFVRSDSVLDYLKELWDKEARSADYYLEQLGYHASESRPAAALEAAERALALAAGAAAARAKLGRVASLRALGQKDGALAA
ncbi:MAG: tetratricopeptide repeat protein, partial [Myxococcales bacterium]|nr:tetratricopeptide repeat protein [Myxococcales bacterium]